MNLNRFNHWLNKRQIQLLESAYQSAQEIKALEDQYFQGNSIGYRLESKKTVVDYVKSLRDRHLLTIRFNLSQFKLNSFLWNPQSLSQEETFQSVGIPEIEIIEKLNFIDGVIKKYRDNSEDVVINSLANTSTLMGLTPEELKQENNESAIARTLDTPIISATSIITPQPQNNWLSWGWLGRNKVKPDYEQQVVQELRIRRIQDQVARRWILILFLIPLLVQVAVKNIVFNPLMGNYSDKYPTKIELSSAIK
ncbi:MAG: hypothetical protein ACRCU2_16590, partial [Planktothrix sp.]